ncbi:hypothetical protein GUJ93_ZPchr0007g3853 [Zizania palustris]|uniref:Uncharacterized protein n=1 Tax=Zizania palustris TaxID=103762 RepID=A0A8J5TJ46_ZIZPA|nr:hypothetical protein GUJ93_ZPchr0007g3853 [Zizania palustris]
MQQSISITAPRVQRMREDDQSTRYCLLKTMMLCRYSTKDPIPPALCSIHSPPENLSHYAWQVQFLSCAGQTQPSGFGYMP